MVAKFTDRFGNDEEIFFKLLKYEEGGRYAIQAWSINRDDGGQWSEPYAMITVNLPHYELPEPKVHGFYAFIDTNNCPWAEQVLFDTGIGIPTGKFRSSGFCNYPIYFIFVSNLKKYRCEI